MLDLLKDDFIYRTEDSEEALKFLEENYHESYAEYLELFLSWEGFQEFKIKDCGSYHRAEIEGENYAHYSGIRLE